MEFVPEIQGWILNELYVDLPYESATPLLSIPKRIFLKNVFTRCVQAEKVYTNTHSSTFHTNQKVDTTQMSINRWMERQNEVYLHNGILFSIEKEWSTDTCNKMDEPSEHTNWKK